MIEVDDAGGGCFIGPEVLVIHRIETGTVRYLYIPPNVIDRIKYAAKILKAAFQELAITREEPIRLCRGEIFDPFQEYLESQGYHVAREKVSESTDCLAELHFMQILYSYGFPRHLTLQDRNYQYFYQLVTCWYYSQIGGHMKTIRKARLHPPFQTRRLVQKYPHLFRLILEEEVS